MASIHDILGELRSVAYDERDKGARFEKLIQAYLKTEPQYQDLYDEVWLWGEYPYRAGRTDTGIDLVGRSRATGEFTAIQCKFYAPGTPMTLGHVADFIAASGKMRDGAPEFVARLWVSTSDNWGRNAEEAIENQNPPVSRLRVQDLDESSIDWSQFSLAQPEVLMKKPHKIPFPHQEKAIANVLAGFEAADRGKLIMACGTGKTYTSLNIVEQMVPAGGTVLFLVPSIALLSQTLKEWTIEAQRPLRSFAVCSDVSVGKRKTEEDTPVVDLAYPATTNPEKLAAKFALRPDDPETITVVFSTYQSIDVVAQAQHQGLPEFDLIVCDEAHRTTGVTLAGDEESAFVRVHNQDYIQGKKRLYMTATPRIYADSSRSKAEEAGAVLTDMNNAEFFGEEFHRLGFGEAVSIGRLTDYKVLVLAVDESYVSTRFQRLLADENNELTLDDAAKIVGCWNGLSKRALTQDEFALDPEPMKRAVAFAKNIAESKKISELFEQVVAREIELMDAEEEDSQNLVAVEAEHVDGTYNVLLRNEKLDWLKEDPGDGHARLLTNARCLSEGVDVPALDAVMFLNPRDSVVDVVQSVGRVMRKLEGKKYGYVILPIGVPADVDPATALSDNKKYRVVWQVLQALRAHDERFDAEVNKIDLTKKTDKLQVGLIGKGGTKQDRDRSESADYGSVTLDFPELAQWREAILAKIVEKVGERRYWENWAKDVAGIAEDHIARIAALVDGSDAALRGEFQRFVKGLQDNLNPFIRERDAIEMLSQHLITKPVFDALFQSYSFSDHNPVSQVMQGMIDALEEQNLDKETERLEKFYDSVRTRAAGITDAAAKQTIVKELYEKFFRTAFTGTSERLGIVYTPNEIVDFINHSVESVLRREFGASISDEGVHVLDPFTGTGTFIVRLLQSGLIKPEDLARKYRYELHANEIVLLAYYVAAINIEETFHSLVDLPYEPFNGIVLTDTFQLYEQDDQVDLMGVFSDNDSRADRQKNLDIRVIIGNPPYRVGQKSANEANQNVQYTSLDKRISETYVRNSTTKTRTSMYDSYVRAIRWASDRIGDAGIVGFVTNNSFIDAKSADGLRFELLREFSSTYVLNLRGNSNVGGEQAKKEGGNVFDVRVGVSILLLAKNPASAEPGRLEYFEFSDYMTKTEKLDFLRSTASSEAVEFETLVPNGANDWINQRSDSFQSFIPLGDPASKGAESETIFRFYSSGIATKRDAWGWNFSSDSLASNVRKLIDNYNGMLQTYLTEGGAPERFFKDPTQVSWVQNLIKDFKNGKPLSYNQDAVRLGTYRPFMKAWVYEDKRLIWSAYRSRSIFPSAESAPVIAISGPGASVFSTLAVNVLPEYDFLPKAQLFPLEYFPDARVGGGGILEGFSSETSGVTRFAIDTFSTLAGRKISAEDVFYYVYGILHSDEYRTVYGSDLKKVMPRIPRSANFEQFVEAGRRLAELHLNYEGLEPYPFTIDARPGSDLRVDRMRYGGGPKAVDKSRIVVNSGVTVSDIPLSAQRYSVGTRSALDWVLDRYRLKVDPDSGIVNDPNGWARESGNPRYILDLLGRVVAMSVETVRIVDDLPSLDPVDGA